MNITRRKLLKFVSNITLLTFIPGITYSHDINKEKKLLLDGYINNLNSKRSAIIIGRLYLNDYPEENNIELLRESLAKLIPYNNMTNQGISKSIIHAMKNDFDSNNSINIHGWILSKTELRLYALSYLNG